MLSHILRRGIVRLLLLGESYIYSQLLCLHLLSQYLHYISEQSFYGERENTIHKTCYSLFVLHALKKALPFTCSQCIFIPSLQPPGCDIWYRLCFTNICNRSSQFENKSVYLIHGMWVNACDLLKSSANYASSTRTIVKPHFSTPVHTQQKTSLTHERCSSNTTGHHLFIAASPPSLGHLCQSLNKELISLNIAIE